jgi:hypothetical protein
LARIGINVRLEPDALAGLVTEDGVREAVIGDRRVPGAAQITRNVVAGVLHPAWRGVGDPHVPFAGVCVHEYSSGLVEDGVAANIVVIHVDVSRLLARDVAFYLVLEGEEECVIDGDIPIGLSGFP